MAVDGSIGAGVAIFHLLDTPADTDTYQVTLNPGQIYDFWAGPNGGNLDPALELANGGALASDDNSAEVMRPTFLFGSFGGGTFTLTIDGVGATPTGLYILTVVNKSLVDDVSEHTFGTVFDGDDASVVGIGTNAVLAEEDVVTSELINRPGNPPDADADVWAVFLSDGQTYTFTVQGATSGVTGGTTDADLHLLTADGDAFALVPVVNGSDETLTATIAGGAGGWYFLEVTGAVGSYRLSFDDATSGAPFGFDVPGDVNGPFAANGAGDEFDNEQSGDDLFNEPLVALDNPFNLPLGDSISGTIENAADEDWYAINLVAGFTYRFTADAGFNQVELSVYDAGEGGILQDAVSGAEPQTLDFTPSASGLYYVAVDGVAAGDVGNFTLTSQLLNVPAPAAAAHNITGLGSAQYVGSDQTDSITGSDVDDAIQGAGGNDTLSGGDGDDAIEGDLASDAVGGDDLLFGNGGDDIVDGGGGKDSIDGGADDDTLAGDAGNDTLIGGAGNDLLEGDEGNDRLEGGIGNDRFVIEGSNDTVIAGAGIDQVSSRFSYTLAADAENLVLLGSTVANGIGNNSNNNIIGSDGANILLGLGGNDGITGVGGNDTIVGGIGRDSLSGLAGNDRFDYNALNELTVALAGRDVINQFQHGDRVNLFNLDARTNIAGNQAFTFVANFTGVSGQVQADLVAANVWRITGDVNGDAAADFAIDVTVAGGFGAFTAADLIL